VVEKVLNIGGKEVKFKSSAAVPRMYRVEFGRDIFVDIQKLRQSFYENVGNKNASNLSIADLTIFENVAYIMAKHADANIPSTIDEWLEGFEMFSIYEILPEILELWGDNVQGDAEAKKNTPQQSEK
jgi:hypothetical protein